MTAATLVARATALRMPRTRILAIGAGALLVALVALAAVLRQRAVGAPFWIDEGLSVGISSHPLSAIPGLLRLDGSPPLYYLLLHVWMSVAGSSPSATHELSVAFAIAAVPAAAWALWPVFGVPAALAAATLVALSPFVGTYADEVRMYSLVFLLATLAAGAYLRVFVLRRRRWAIGLGLLLAALMYTHAWAAFFGLAAGAGAVVLVALAPAAERRALAIDVAIAFGIAALAFAPWLPTALYQAHHTGAPWSRPPAPRSIGRALTRIMGGVWPETILLAAGGAGAAILLVRGRGRDRRALLALLGIAGTTLLLAYLASRHITPAWSLRYLVIVLAPLLLAIAAGAARAGVPGLVALAIVAVFFYSGKPTVHQLSNKSNVAAISARIAPQLSPHAVVFSLQPEQVPALRYYLPAGLRYATPLGSVADPRVMDWRDAMKRLRAATYDATLGAAASGLAPGQRLALVTPRFGHPSAPWTRFIRKLARTWTTRLLRDHRLRVLARLKPVRYANRSTVSVILLSRR